MYNEYPYTDFHELNLDWFLNEFKAVHNHVDTLDATVTEFTDFVTNYFDNLDVQEEINNKLDALVADGTIAELLLPLTTDAVGGWLEEHITPTTPPVDDTLTIAGAAADAKTTGDMLNVRMALNPVNSLTDFDDAISPGYYLCAYSTSYNNDPIGSSHRRLLIVFPAGRTINVLKTQILIKYDTGNEAIYIRYYTQGGGWSTWQNLTSVSFINNISKLIMTGNEGNSSISITDLNDAVHAGYYTFAYDASIVNDPVGANHRRLLLVYRAGESTDAVKTQVMIKYDTGDEAIYIRYYTVAGGWSAWRNLNAASILSAASAVTMIGNEGNSSISITDLNDAVHAGYYTFAYGASIVNDPVGANHRRLLLVYRAGESTDAVKTQVMIKYDTGDEAIYIRYYIVAGGWSAWQRIDSLSDVTTLEYQLDVLTELTTSDNTIMEYTSDVFTGTAPNTGARIKILSYNVANYNDDTAVYISDDKRFNFKKMLSAVNPDFIGIQEDRTYIDSNNTKLALSYIYQPVFPFKYGEGGCTLYSKYAHDGSSRVLEYSNGRSLRYARYDVENNKKLLFICTHPSPGTDVNAVVARLTQYTELMQWIHQEITLNQYSTSIPVNCPSWDYCIITGDMNSTTDDDKTNLHNLTSARNFTMANGAWLGWLETCKNPSGTIRYAIDNIICSPNVIINSITAHQSMYNDLYSDHYPFSIDVTLL